MITIYEKMGLLTMSIVLVYNGSWCRNEERSSEIQMNEQQN